ncbi:MAG: hypothetical protein KGN74_02565 [Gemmatimonadota bacterium]|nr:hypothetical protein [Gemmatimonadota bacterium]
MSGERSRVLTQGLIAGLIGYGTVAVVFAVANLLSGRSVFYTAALLGASLFYGVRDPAQVTVTAQYVFAYNGVHLLVFLGFGLVSAGLAELSEHLTQLWYVGLVMFFFVAFHIVAAMQVVSIPVQEAISAVGVWAAGAAAALLMGSYLLMVHPKIRAGESWEG